MGILSRKFLGIVHVEKAPVQVQSKIRENTVEPAWTTGQTSTTISSPFQQRRLRNASRQCFMASPLLTPWPWPLPSLREEEVAGPVGDSADRLQWQVVLAGQKITRVCRVYQSEVGIGSTPEVPFSQGDPSPCSAPDKKSDTHRKPNKHRLTQTHHPSTRPHHSGAAVRARLMGKSAVARCVTTGRSWAKQICSCWELAILLFGRFFDSFSGSHIWTRHETAIP